MRRILALITICLTLEGCIFVVGAAAGAAAVAAVYDHRTIERTLEDAQIANTITERLKAASSSSWEASHIEITTFHHVVLLSGETPSAQYREQAEQIASSVRNVAKVYNQITVQNPSSSLTRTSDTWITTKIKTLMLANEELKSGNIKVITENGTVFLMGIVSRSQADIAVDIARQASGVQRVVKIFQ